MARAGRDAAGAGGLCAMCAGAEAFRFRTLGGRIPAMCGAPGENQRTYWFRNLSIQKLIPGILGF